MELSLELGVLDPHGSAGGGDEGGLQPRGALAYAGRAALAGAFIVAGAQPSPRDQVRSTGEARHVDADLRHHDLRGEITHPRQARREAGATVDRRQGFSHVSVDLEQSLLECCDEFQMYLQQPPVVRSDALVQGGDELGPLSGRCLEPDRRAARGRFARR
jgi:hypothetical protein